MPQQLRAEETRSRIISAAQECFSRNGYEATSVSDICSESGVTKGAFYYHFQSKQALFLELLNYWLGLLDKQFAMIREESLSIENSIIEMAGSTRLIFQESRHYLPMFLEFWLQSVRDPIIWNQVIDPYRRYLKFFEQLFIQGKQEGTINPNDPGLASKSLVAMALGLILLGLMDPTAADWGTITQDSVRQLLAGMSSEK